METKPIRVKNLPLLLKKSNIKIIKHHLAKDGPTKSSLPQYREDVIFDTNDASYVKGEFHRMILVNKFNSCDNTLCTIAKFISKKGKVFEKTSDTVVEVIGQKQYKTIFTALCSIIDPELKVRSILALLKEKSSKSKETVTSDNNTVSKVNVSTQTDEIRIDIKRKPKRLRKYHGPYIVQDTNLENNKVKKVVINIAKNELDSIDSSITESNLDITKIQTEQNTYYSKTQPQNNKLITNVLNDDHSETESMDPIPDLGYLYDDISNDSRALTHLSDAPTLPDVLTNTQLLFKKIDHHTEAIEKIPVQTHCKIRMMDGTEIDLPCKPESELQIATKEILQCLSTVNKKKILQHQMIIDERLCMTKLDEDENLPIHIAVLNNDIGLLSRQCGVLSIQGISVDVPAKGLTALQMAVQQESPQNARLLACLVAHGAAPLRADRERRAAHHRAANRDADTLKALLHACVRNARNILMDNDDLWKPEMEKQSDKQLADFLMKHMCSMYDTQGYNPLMIASMSGLYENVRVLLEYSPNSVNDTMPTTGNTALFLAVEGSYNSSCKNGDMSKVVDHFRKTIEILIEYGADITIDNYCGTNVNTILSELNCPELSMLIANKLTQANFNKHAIPDHPANYDKVILVKDKQGIMNFKSLECEKKNKNKRNVVKQVINLKKPVVIENILIKPVGNTVPSTSAGKSKIVKSAKTENVNKILITGTNQLPVPILKKKVIKIISPLNNGDLKRKSMNEKKLLKKAKRE